MQAQNMLHALLSRCTHKLALTMLQVSDRADSPQAGHYTPMLDPSSRRVDYLDLATPQSASRPSQPLHRPPRRSPPPALYPPPPASFGFSGHDNFLWQPAKHAVPPRASNVGYQIKPFSRGRRHKRPGIREHDREVYEVGTQPSSVHTSTPVAALGVVCFL